MAGELAASQQKLERSRVDLERKNLQLDERRRYIETVLERIATGVVSVDGRRAHRNDQHRGAAAARAWTARSSAARSAEAVCPGRPAPARHAAAARPPQPLPDRRRRNSPSSARGASSIWRRPRRRSRGRTGELEGAVLVFDDVTPLIRTQRVAAWRDVARRLAHEIKNPLTPIQLCAERMRRHFAQRAARGAGARRGVHGHHRRRSGVAQGAGRRVRPVRADAGAAGGAVRPPRRCSTETLALYNGLFRDIRLERRFAADLPPVRVDRRADPAGR